MYKILVPIDGSDHSLKALHIAGDLAEKYTARILLLYVITTGKPASEFLNMTIARKFDPELQARLQNSLESGHGRVNESLLEQVGHQTLKIATARTSRRGIETQILDIAKGDPAENILSAHKLFGASTIVMGSRGGNFSTLSSFGSVSHAVFARADCTCISVK